MSWVILSLLLSTVPPIVKPARGRFGAFLDRAKASAPSVDPDRAKASVLLQRRSLADCEAAVELLERALRRAPDDASLCLECASALNAVMRQRTNSNTLHITRMLDTAENKRVWAQHGIAAIDVLIEPHPVGVVGLHLTRSPHKMSRNPGPDPNPGPRALDLAKKAKSARPTDPDALLAYCDAFFFANSVKGVMAAATTGSGLRFRANSKELIARFPALDGGIGHCYLGAFCAPRRPGTPA